MDPECIYEFCLFFGVNQPCYNSPINKQCCVEHQPSVTDANLNEWDSNERQYVVSTILRFLNECSSAHGSFLKTKIANKLYVFLVKHRRFIIRHPTFSKTCLNKLYEFKEDPYVKNHPELFNIDYYIQKLYPNLTVADTVKITDIVFDF